MKSSLNGKRVKTDPAFIETMHHARLLGHGSRLASILYRAIPKEEKKHSLYRKLTGQAMLLLKEGKTDSEILEKLRYTI